MIVDRFETQKLWGSDRVNHQSPGVKTVQQDHSHVHTIMEIY